MSALVCSISSRLQRNWVPLSSRVTLEYINTVLLSRSMSCTNCVAPESILVKISSSGPFISTTVSVSGAQQNVTSLNSEANNSGSGDITTPVAKERVTCTLILFVHMHDIASSLSYLLWGYTTESLSLQPTGLQALTLYSTG